MAMAEGAPSAARTQSFPRLGARVLVAAALLVAVAGCAPALRSAGGAAPGSEASVPAGTAHRLLAYANALRHRTRDELQGEFETLSGRVARSEDAEDRVRLALVRSTPSAAVYDIDAALAILDEVLGRPSAPGVSEVAILVRDRLRDQGRALEQAADRRCAGSAAAGPRADRLQRELDAAQARCERLQRTLDELRELELRVNEFNAPAP